MLKLITQPIGFKIFKLADTKTKPDFFLKFASLEELKRLGLSTAPMKKNNPDIFSLIMNKKG